MEYELSRDYFFVGSTDYGLPFVDSFLVSLKHEPFIEGVFLDIVHLTVF